MAPTRKSSTSHGSDTPARTPRPPNAWIIYRSEKFRTIPPPPPGTAPQLQANVSKIVAAMWKAEPPTVRAHYERLSDIMKIEHQLKNPGYHFRPRTKAEKERLKQEKLAEKERERAMRGARKSKPRPRVNTSKPLFTTDTRFGPGGPSPPASGSSTPPVDQYSSQEFPVIMSLLTPPADQPASPSDHSPMPAAPISSPSPYPPSPASTTIPLLVAPQPGVPQPQSSTLYWCNPQPEQLTQPNEQEFNPFRLDHGSSMSQFATLQEYLPVPISNRYPQQQPLGWSVDNPFPLTDQPLEGGLLAPTDTPYTYNFDAINTRPVGSQVIRISMGSGALLPYVGDSDDDDYLKNFTGLVAGLGSTECEPSAFASTSGNSFDQQNASTLPTGLEGYPEPDQYLDEQDLQEQATFIDLLSAMDVVDRQTQAAVPYVPPAGASNPSCRVSAE